MRKFIGAAFLLAVGSTFSGLAQDVGDHYTAGYTSNRTYLNSNLADFKVPLTPTGTIDLAEVSNADSLLVIETRTGPLLLVGEGAPGSAYRLYDGQNGTLRWTVPLPGLTGPLNYTPSFSGDIVLLGGAATTGVRAIRVSTGAELWRDNTVGDTAGRYPVLTDGLALYAGRNAIVAADPLRGPTPAFWRFSTTTAEAPISFFGNQAYFLEDEGVLRAVSGRTGVENWNVMGVGSTNPNIISTQGSVFLNSSDAGLFGALRSDSALGIWARPATNLSETPALALAYNRLYLFTSQDSEDNAQISAHDPETGAPLWSAVEGGPGIDFGQVANNLVFYYHQATGRLRARDAFSGNLVWSRRLDGVRGLVAAGTRLYALRASQVQIFDALNDIYFAHIADGGGQQTLLTLNNGNDGPVTGTVSFFGDDGTPLTLDVEGMGSVSSAPFNIPARSATAIRTLGNSAMGRGGWAQVVSSAPISGSSIFEFVDSGGLILNEAGVADSAATGSGNVYVEVALPPVRQAALSTGVAVANPSDEDALVTYTLLNGAGDALASTDIMLGPREHTASFVEQIFPAQVGQERVATLVIESDVPVVVTALRTQSGLQLSSYAIGQR